MAYTLQKGENIALHDSNTQELIIATKWATKQQISSDIKISSFLLTESNKVRNEADFIFDKRPTNSDLSVLLKNNLFKINLAKITHDIRSLAFVLSVHHDNVPENNISPLCNVVTKVFDFHSKQELISYSLESINTETAIILALLYRYNNQWKFKAVGQGYNSGLNVLAQKFGTNFSADIIKTTTILQKQESNIAKEKPIISQTIIQPVINSTQRNKKETSAKKDISKNAPALNPDVDLFNTKILSDKAQYQPIEQWFNRKFIITTVNEAAMDTTGFFDELAVALGDDFELLKVISYNIKRRTLMNKNTAYIDLRNYTKQEADTLKRFCKMLYEYSFVAKYFYNQQDNKIGLHLQSATRVVHFFKGEWLEWFAFMKIAQWCQEKNKAFSCVRNIHLNFLDSYYEVDVFFLIDNKPLFIECKSGEYRSFIDKYSKLRKNLAIAKPYFLFLTSELEDSKAQGLTATFEITFINPAQLVAHLDSLF